MDDDRDDEAWETDGGRLSLRGQWIFRYPPAQVLEAAEKKAIYHGERLAWWKQQTSEAEVALKEKGFEYRQRLHTRGDDVEIVGDPELARRVTRCKEKTAYHTTRQEVYETWARALRSQSQRASAAELKLKIEDVLFFGL